MTIIQQLQDNYTKAKNRGARPQLLKKLEEQIDRLIGTGVGTEKAIAPEVDHKDIASKLHKTRIRLSQNDVDDYRDLGVSEVHLYSEKLGKDIYIVLDKSDADRIEYTPEELLRLSQAEHLFDGEIVSVGKYIPAGED